MKLLRHCLFSFPKNDRRGVALVLVLAFVVLLASIIVAFFSRVQNEQQISRASANQTKVKLLADGAVDTVVGNLKQEIVAGSTLSSPAAGVTIYTPTQPKDMVPVRDSDLDGKTGLENLVKVSTISGGKATDAASESRKIDLKRWNKPLFVTPTSDTDDSPATTFPVPQWIYVQRDGKQVGIPSTSASSAKTNDPNAIIGRYAYVIYDEGGLLDVNVAGYPSALKTDATLNADPYYKGSAFNKSAETFADFTQIPGLTIQANADKFANALAGWRQYASAQAGGSFPNYSFSQTSLKKFVDAIRSSQTGFMTTETLASGATFDKSDKFFTGRQQFLQFLNALADSGTVSKTNLRQAAPYFTTFSRALNQPSYVAPVQAGAPKVLAANLGGNSAFGGDEKINPSFLNVRVQTDFTRYDGSTAKAGDPLVNKRFPLQRLAWVTYKGPSHDRAQSDPDIQSLIKNGVPWSYLQLGTADNIQKYFGLTWRNNRWEYDIHVNTDHIALLDEVKSLRREPDFFELLKAGITVGSLGKAMTPSKNYVDNSQSANTLPDKKVVPPMYAQNEAPANFRYAFDTSVDYHIIQIAANIFSEVNPTSYPVRIAFDDGSARGMWEFQGVTDLPYLSYVFNGVLRTQEANPATPSARVDGSPIQFPQAQSGSLGNSGNAYAIQVPAVWNPYDPNGTAGVQRPTKFRIVVDSNDPLTLANGGAGHSIWCAALASPRTTGVGGNNGMNAPWIPGNVFSFDATTNPTSKTGSVIHDEVTFSDNGGSLYREPTLIIRTTVGGASRTAGNITSIDANPLPGVNDSTGTKYAPLVLGSFPLAFLYSKTGINGTSYSSTGAPVLYAGQGAIGQRNGDTRVYLTYRLQYQDSGGQWVTYDTKYGRTTYGFFSFRTRTNLSPSIIRGPDNFNPFSWATAIDPRTARFGLFMDIQNMQRSGLWMAPPPWNGTNSWIKNASGNADTAAAITYPIRPDYNSGFTLVNSYKSDDVYVRSLGGPGGGSSYLDDSPANMMDVPFPVFQAGWTRPIIQTVNNDHPYVPTFAPGMYAQNNPSAPHELGITYSGSDPFGGGGAPYRPTQPAYYADADGVVRRASGAYVPRITSSSPVGLATASIQGYNTQPSSLETPASKTPFNQAQSRPLLLHRPFRSVAELGYVFRDLPWKNLDFFTPESGDAALLDIFCVNETNDPSGLVAGKINLNTHQIPALAAIVSGAYIDDPLVYKNATVGSISGTAASTIASALQARTTDPTYGQLTNLSELVGKWRAKAAISPGIKYSLSVSSKNAGVDLPAPNYCDGQKSYTGFSGAASTSSGIPKNLTDAYASAFSSDAKLLASMTQIQRFREAPVRALASAGQARIWNLMADVIAQSGRKSSSGNFTVDGEQRYWVHIAVDRVTGKILDKQVELVKE
jgi:hypothetical protein